MGKRNNQNFVQLPFNTLIGQIKYKEKNGEFMLIFTNQQCSIENGILKFPKIMELEVKTRLDNMDFRPAYSLLKNWLMDLSIPPLTAIPSEEMLSPMVIMMDGNRK